MTAPIFAPRKNLAELHERTGAFAAQIAATLEPEPSIAVLIERAHEAAKWASAVIDDPRWRRDMSEGAQLAYEARCNVAEEAERLARQAMINGLRRLGITKALAVKIGGVL